jgi:hypothetical protein
VHLEQFLLDPVHPGLIDLVYLVDLAFLEVLEHPGCSVLEFPGVLVYPGVLEFPECLDPVYLEVLEHLEFDQQDLVHLGCLDLEYLEVPAFLVNPGRLVSKVLEFLVVLESLGVLEHLEY